MRGRFYILIAASATLIGACWVIPSSALAASATCPAGILQSIEQSNAIAASVTAIIPGQSGAVAASLTSAVENLESAIESLTTQAGCVLTSVPSATNFPQLATVTRASLNVRSAPVTTAPLAGSQVLYDGNQFTAVAAVTGQDVAGNSTWLQSSVGNYVWSGGTSLAGIVGTTAATTAGTTETGHGVVGNTPATSGAPEITAIQGYNATTGVYTNNTVAPGQYMILYGSFAGGSGSDAVTVNGFIFPASAVTYDGTAQINVHMGAIVGNSLNVSVSNANGMSQVFAVNVSGGTTAGSGNGSGGSGSSAAKIPFATLESEIENTAGFQNIISLATAAGYVVNMSNDGQGTALATIIDPSTNLVVASISETDD